jgi:DNA-binding beta-propeller fold protein YncE
VLDIAVNKSNYAFVVDEVNNRIQVFDPAGTYVTQWGSAGTGNGQFANPFSIAIDSGGNLYVADEVNNRIQVFDPNGVYVAQWGSAGTGNGQFNIPTGIAIDGRNNVYVADHGNSRIEKFTTSFSPMVIPLPGYATLPTDPDNDGLYEDLNGNGRKDFNDIVLFFKNMAWITASEPVAAFDFNHNGRINFNDLVVLFREVPSS